MRKIRLLTVALFLVAPFAANADVVSMTFEGVVGDNDTLVPATPYLEQGFVLTSSFEPQAVEGIFGATSGVNTNGTAVFAWCTDCGQGLQTISMGADDGSIFDFLSFDSATLDGGPTGVLAVIGYLDGGGSVGVIIDVTENWTTFDMGWTGLTHLEFTAYYPDNAGPVDLAFDNLTMDVPEPGTLALLGIGLLGMGIARRRRKA